MKHTSTSAAVVPFARPATWTTLPRELAPLMERPPFSPRASRRALSAMPKFIFGAPTGALVRRAERERSALYMSCCHVSLTSPFGGRLALFCVGKRVVVRVEWMVREGRGDR